MLICVAFSSGSALYITIARAKLGAAEKEDLPELTQNA